MWWNDALFWVGLLAGFTVGTLYAVLYIAISFSLLYRVTRIKPAKIQKTEQKTEPETETLQKDDFWQKWQKERQGIVNCDTMPTLPVIERLDRN